MKRKHILSILIIQFIIVFILNGCKKNEESIINQFTDLRDGQIYRTVTTGGQIWMAENLNYETDNGSWVYNNDTSYSTTYGRLYNWETACTVCPNGWHLPSDDEWTILIDYLGGSSIAGGKMKEADTIHWNSPNFGATNESSFSALPSGARYDQNDFRGLGHIARFWSSTEDDSEDAWERSLDYFLNSVMSYGANKSNGFSIRCIKE